MASRAKGEKGKKSAGSDWQAVLVVIGLAFLVRVVYVLQARGADPLFFSPQLDALYHHQWALAIVTHQEFINDAYFRAPLYPFFLALIYRLFGVNLFWARLIQAGLGAASCGLLFLLGRGLFNRRVGLVAGLLMAVYPLFIYFDGELLISVLLVFLILLGFFAFYFAWKKERYWFVPGLVFGLGAIARPNVLLFLSGLFFWFVFQYRAQFWRRALPFFFGVLVPIVPVTVRNYLKSGRVVLIAWQAGTNFYIGNNRFSDGTTAIVPGTRGSWWGGYNDVKMGAERALGKKLKGAEIDRFWFKKGLEFWRDQPWKALRLTLRKAYLWFSGYEVSNDRDLYFFKRYTLLNFLLFKTPILKFPFGVVLPLALAGIYLTRRRWRTLLPVYIFLFTYALSFVPFFITARYRMPVVPFFLIFAVQGVSELVRLSARRRAVPLSIAVLSFIFFNLNLAGTGRIEDPAQNYFTAGLGYYERGRLDRAEDAINRALALDSATNILSLKVTLLLEQGRIEEAERVAEAAVRLHPDEPDAYGIAGNVRAQMGDLSGAEGFFQRVVELDPYSAEGWNNLGNIALLKRDLATARRSYEQALHLSPAWAMPLFHLGLVYYYEGDRDAARNLWQRVLKIEPNHRKAAEALRQLR